MSDVELHYLGYKSDDFVRLYPGTAPSDFAGAVRGGSRTVNMPILEWYRGIGTGADFNFLLKATRPEIQYWLFLNKTLYKNRLTHVTSIILSQGATKKN